MPQDIVNLPRAEGVLRVLVFFEPLARFVDVQLLLLGDHCGERFGLIGDLSHNRAARGLPALAGRGIAATSFLTVATL